MAAKVATAMVERGRWSGPEKEAIMEREASTGSGAPSASLPSIPPSSRNFSSRSLFFRFLPSFFLSRIPILSIPLPVDRSGAFAPGFVWIWPCVGTVGCNYPIWSLHAWIRLDLVHFGGGAERCTVVGFSFNGFVAFRVAKVFPVLIRSRSNFLDVD